MKNARDLMETMARMEVPESDDAIINFDDERLCSEVQTLHRLIREAREVLAEAKQEQALSSTMQAYSYASDDETGAEFPVEVSVTGTSMSVDMGEGDTGLSVMMEVRDSTHKGSPVPHGHMWLGVAPKGSDTVFTVLLDLENGKPLSMDTADADISLSPLAEAQPAPGMS